MNRATRVVVGGLAVAFVTTTAWATNVYSATVQIQKVSVEACSQDSCAGSVYVTFNPSKPIDTSAKCSQHASGYYQLGGDATSREELRQIAIAAKLAGAPVRVAWNDQGGTSSCNSSGYPIARIIQLQ